MRYPFKRVITDIGNYFFIRRTIKNNMGSIEWDKFKLRVDWVGRIYTVINLPEEVANHNPQIQQGYVLSRLRDYDSLFMQLGISSEVFPELRKIETLPSFLLILSPDRDYLRLWPFLKFLFRCGLYFIILKIFYLIAQANQEHLQPIFDYLSKLF